MRLTDFLSTDRIRVPLSGTAREGVVRELLALLPLPDEATRETVFQAILEREELMSTGIGNGIAIPHGIVPVRLELTGALGISPDPVDFSAIDGRPVHLIFLLAADEETPGRNLKALARIARLLHRDAFRKALMESGTAGEAMQTIQDEEARHKI
jgi:PTS system nitrogen regulatory IIA component